ncbi:hypothetical protein DLM_2879 [Aquitalea magnusonii]|uniref:Uncharacterized protein n=1 Tax=Aquitalea magnusonii TaxID=332411 RepID=A0A3G9G8G6_9NEIS|nr:hypothetical protein DLM_0120 [Aquitalea magnusonii]BBF86480.1 hypothetical protein DLM_2879 [Aquitalea magnusonii]
MLRRLAVRPVLSAAARLAAAAALTLPRRQRVRQNAVQAAESPEVEV